MADEENQKPEDQQEAETATATGATEVVEGNGADAGADSVQVQGSAPEGSEEAIEAIAENVKNRAAEIEDVLAEVSEPGALPKAADELSAQAEVSQTQAKESVPSVQVGAEETNDADEPNLQISVGGEILRISTAHPLIEDIADQLQKSQRFTLYSVGALCIALLAAVLFYVLMAAQLSSKVKEIDSMLGAMAKRTLQMTKGIESFSALETRVDQGLANQLMLQEMLAANEIAMAALNQQFEAMPKTMETSTNDALSATEQALRTQLQNIETETSRLLTQLDRAQQSLDEQGAATGSLRGIRRELTEMRSGLAKVEKTVGDLYVIERARVAKQMQDRGPVAFSE